MKLKRTADGSPQRVIIQAEYEDRKAIKEGSRGVARYSKNDGGWTIPIDPTIIRELYRRFPDLEVEDGLSSYLQEVREVQSRVLCAPEDCSELDEKNGLYPFQRGSVRFLTEIGRGILGHRMGLGKTVIACKALAHIGATRAVIVCPNAVKWSWAEHIRRWNDTSPEEIFMLESKSGRLTAKKEEDAVVFKGGGNDRDEQIEQILQQDSFTLILNYDQLRIHQKTLCGYDYDVIIADEAHRLKDYRAQRTQAMVSVSKRTAYLWLLTGTPIRSDYTDIWPLLHMCDPVRFSGYWNFAHTYLIVAPSMWGGVDILGPQNPEEFNRVLSRYMFRKTKEEVLPELPEIIYQDIKLPMSGPQEYQYKKMEKEFVVTVEKEVKDGQQIQQVLQAENVVSQLIRLRQICLTPAVLGGKNSSGKLEALHDVLEDSLETGRVAIFTCFRGFVPFIEEVVSNYADYGLIVGGQTTEQRKEVERLLWREQIDVVIGTIQAMGEGLNLQPVKTAIFTDVDWTPAVNEQAEERIHRADTKESPTVIRLYHPRTVEADIRSVLKEKEKIVNSTVGKVEAVRKLLSRR